MKLFTLSLLLLTFSSAAFADKAEDCKEWREDAKYFETKILTCSRHTGCSEERENQLKKLLDTVKEELEKASCEEK